MTKTTELIPVTAQAINGTERLTCSARDLHKFLEVKMPFEDWIKQHIEKGGFVEAKTLAPQGVTNRYTL